MNIPALGLGAPARTGLGDVIPFQIDPTRILELQKQLDAAVAGTTASVKACPNLPAAVVDGWMQFAKYEATWSTAVSAQLPLLVTIVGSIPLWWAYRMNSLYEEGLSLQAQIKAWQVKLTSAGCTLAIPLLPDPPSPAQQDKQREDLLGTIKTAAIAVGVLAVAVVAAPVVKEAVATFGATRKAVTGASENPTAPKMHAGGTRLTHIGPSRYSVSRMKDGRLLGTVWLERWPQQRYAEGWYYDTSLGRESHGPFATRHEALKQMTGVFGG